MAQTMASYYHNKGVVLGDKTDFRRNALSSISNDDNNKEDKPECMETMTALSAYGFVTTMFSGDGASEN
eukprot:1251964-Ditylum_brightwellii.AAC.1